MKRIITLCAGIVFLFCPSASAAQAPAAQVLDRAISAAGGRPALEGSPALEWQGQATIYLPTRVLEIAGRWSLQPPDDAIVATYPVEQGPGATRRLILAGAIGWTQRGDAPPTLMPVELLTEERHQFYLYSLLRLVPLLTGEFSLQPAPPDSLGQFAIRVIHPAHPEVILYLDAEYRVSALRTIFAAPEMTAADSQLIRLSGTAESRGVRWFSEMRILRGGKRYFDLRLTDFQASEQLRHPLLDSLTPPR